MRDKIIAAIAERVVKESIASITVSYLYKSATVGIVLGEIVEDAFVPDHTTLKYTDISFEELMSANPIWAPNKPEGNFRVEDIFALLDHKEII